MTNSDQLKELIAQCQNNDRKGQRKLFERYSGLLMSICYRYSKNEAEDLLQMVFVKIFNAIKTFEGTGSFEGWIKKIAVNTAITEYHKKNILKNSEDIGDFLESDIDEKTIDILSKLEEDELLEMIASLPSIYRITFNMYVIEGYKHHEIAELLQIPEGTSKSQLSRARKLLQEKIEAQNIKLNSNRYV